MSDTNALSDPGPDRGYTVTSEDPRKQPDPDILAVRRLHLPHCTFGACAAVAEFEILGFYPGTAPVCRNHLGHKLRDLSERF